MNLKLRVWLSVVVISFFLWLTLAGCFLLLVGCGSVIDKRDQSNSTVDIASTCYVSIIPQITAEQLSTIEDSSELEILEVVELQDGSYNVTTCNYDLSEQDNDIIPVPK